MGIRLNVEVQGHPELNFYGTKLYGYVELNKLESFKYFQNEFGLFEDTDTYLNFVDAGLELGTDEFILSADQFKTFIDLYIKDYEKYHIYDIAMDMKNAPELVRIINTDDPKIIKWW